MTQKPAEGLAQKPAEGTQAHREYFSDSMNRSGGIWPPLLLSFASDAGDRNSVCKLSKQTNEDGELPAGAVVLSRNNLN